jgi:hypothetical protein
MPDGIPAVSGVFALNYDVAGERGHERTDHTGRCDTNAGLRLSDRASRAFTSAAARRLDRDCAIPHHAAEHGADVLAC